MKTETMSSTGQVDSTRAQRVLSNLNTLRQQLKGFAVVDAEGQWAGEVRDLVLDATGQLNLLLAQTGLGQDEKLMLLTSKSVQKVSARDRTVRISLTLEDLSYLPRYGQMVDSQAFVDSQEFNPIAAPAITPLHQPVDSLPAAATPPIQFPASTASAVDGSNRVAAPVTSAAPDDLLDAPVASSALGVRDVPVSSDASVGPDIPVTPRRADAYSYETPIFSDVISSLSEASVSSEMPIASDMSISSDMSVSSDMLASPDGSEGIDVSVPVDMPVASTSSDVSVSPVSDASDAPPTFAPPADPWVEETEPGLNESEFQLLEDGQAEMAAAPPLEMMDAYLESWPPDESSEPEVPLHTGGVIELPGPKTVVDKALEASLDRSVDVEETEVCPLTPVSFPTDAVLDTHTIPLQEERLVVNSQRRKVGEVVVRKEIATRMVTVPVQYERLIVEEVGDATRPLAEIELGTAHNGAAVPIQQVRQALTVQGTFPSVRAASWVLDAIARQSKSGAIQVQVELLLDDAEHQALYQQWFDRCAPVAKSEQ